LADREPTYPPSDPRPAARSLPSRFPVEEKPGRAVLVGATLFGLVLVVAGLYVWRRPHAAVDAAAEAAASSAAGLAVEDAHAPLSALDAGAGPSPVTLSEARILGCHDKGPHKTPAEQCDHVAAIEQALSKAIEQTAACAEEPSGPIRAGKAPATGTIEYVADVSFLRHKVKIHLPRSGRSLHERHVVTACGAAVREAMQSVPLEGEEHQHARYQISVTATYRGKSQT